MRTRDWESFEHFNVISMVDKNRVRRGDKSIGHGSAFSCVWSVYFQFVIRETFL